MRIPGPLEIARVGGALARAAGNLASDSVISTSPATPVATINPDKRITLNFNTGSPHPNTASSDESMEHSLEISDTIHLLESCSQGGMAMPSDPIFGPPPSPGKRRTLSRLSALSLASWLPDVAMATPIHALPRSALVIGNGAYADAPLANPVNDASAIGAKLTRLGFSVDLQINAKRETMENAMHSYQRQPGQESTPSGCFSSPATACNLTGETSWCRSAPALTRQMTSLPRRWKSADSWASLARQATP